HPLFAWLREEKGGAMGALGLGDKIKWNFTKFLIGKDGQVIKRYGSTTAPESIGSDIEAALGG
ncbi:MAG: glutathione peroxidase, partial [Nocardioides sp.]